MTPVGMILHGCGDDMRLGSKRIRGVISCLDTDDGEIHALPLDAGAANDSKYILITDCRNVSEGSCLICGGREYVIMRVEPVRAFGAFSHNECVLRLKGVRQIAK